MQIFSLREFQGEIERANKAFSSGSFDEETLNGLFGDAYVKNNQGINGRALDESHLGHLRINIVLLNMTKVAVPINCVVSCRIEIFSRVPLAPRILVYNKL